jgi:hypothetical protein
MRTLGIVIVIFLAVVYLGGAVNLSGAPLFAYLDSVLGVDAFMAVYYGVFFFLQKGEREFERTTEKVRAFQERPVGIDNMQKYRQLDDAGKD